MKSEDPKKYLASAIAISAAAGKELASLYKKSEMTSRDSSIKTKFDKIADKLIITEIRRLFPEHSILTEETGMIDNHSRFMWIIDPIDGTGNFVNHNPLFCVSVALWIDGKPAIGVIEAPMLGERFFAVKGGGAYRVDIKSGRKTRLKVSAQKNLPDSYIIFCTGHKFEKRRSLAIYDKLYLKTQRLRQLGSAGIELAWVASGRAEAFMLPGGYAWDVAAGILLVTEAGGAAYEFGGAKFDYGKLIAKRETDAIYSNGKLPSLKKLKI